MGPRGRRGKLLATVQTRCLTDGRWVQEATGKPVPAIGLCAVAGSFPGLLCREVLVHRAAAPIEIPDDWLAAFHGRGTHEAVIAWRERAYTQMYSSAIAPSRHFATVTMRLPSANSPITQVQSPDPKAMGCEGELGRRAPNGIDESLTCGNVLRNATRGFLSLPVHKNIISVVMGEDAVPVGLVPTVEVEVVHSLEVSINLLVLHELLPSSRRANRAKPELDSPGPIFHPSTRVACTCTHEQVSSNNTSAPAYKGSFQCRGDRARTVSSAGSVSFAE